MIALPIVIQPRLVPALLSPRGRTPTPPLPYLPRRPANSLRAPSLNPPP
jgi:hypothetical protein